MLLINKNWFLISIFFLCGSFNLIRTEENYSGQKSQLIRSKYPKQALLELSEKTAQQLYSETRWRFIKSSINFNLAAILFSSASTIPVYLLLRSSTPQYATINLGGTIYGIFNLSYLVTLPFFIYYSMHTHKKKISGIFAEHERKAIAITQRSLEA